MAAKNINRFYPLFYLLLKLCSVYHRLYYRRFEVIGMGNIPDNKPLIFASCHQNALMDALAVIFAARRQIVFLARADIFRKKLTATILRFIRILPVYRIRDGYSSLNQNQETFDEVNEVLNRNIPIGIFPEGLHLGKKKLKPLRKGIARMAFQAEAESGFKLDLQIVPTGLDYSDYHKPGSDLLVIFGQPIRVADYREQYQQNTAFAINTLIDDLSKAISDIIIDIRPESEEVYLEIRRNAESYAREEIKRQRVRNNLRNKFFLQKQYSERCNHLYLSDPAKYKEFLNEIQSSPGIKTSRLSLNRILFSLLLFPLAALGFLVNLIPANIPTLLTRNIRDPHFVSSVRFGAGFILFNLWYMALTLLIILLFSNIYVIAVLIISLPVSALAALYFYRGILYKTV